MANAIFNNKIDIDIFFNKKKSKYLKFLKILFKQLITKFFQSLKLKKINGVSIYTNYNQLANEILVEQFLKKNIPFLAITEIIMVIMRDKNYRKYATKTLKS